MGRGSDAALLETTRLREVRGPRREVVCRLLGAIVKILLEATTTLHAPDTDARYR